jgi:hypothetical protein
MNWSILEPFGFDMASPGRVAAATRVRVSAKMNGGRGGGGGAL